jgi:hypothetical protein
VRQFICRIIPQRGRGHWGAGKYTATFAQDNIFRRNPRRRERLRHRPGHGAVLCQYRTPLDPDSMRTASDREALGTAPTARCPRRLSQSSAIRAAMRAEREARPGVSHARGCSGRVRSLDRPGVRLQAGRVPSGQGRPQTHRLRTASRSSLGTTFSGQLKSTGKWLSSSRSLKPEARAEGMWSGFR